MRFIPRTLNLLRKFGFKFHLDWDNELTITCPDSLDPQRVANYLAENFYDSIVNEVKREGEHAREQYVGGPFNGQRHGKYWGPVTMSAKKHGKPFEGKAHWCAYWVQQDGRATFCGMETSEKKARQLAIRTHANPAKGTS